MTDKRPYLPCPVPGCYGHMRIPLEMVAAMPAPGTCGCGRRGIAVIQDANGEPKLARLDPVGVLRKGDHILVLHTHTGASDGGGEWHSVETVGSGGKKPRYADGSPIDMNSVVGVLPGVLEP